MVDTAPFVDQKPKLSPLDQKFELADQSISERRNSLLTLLEITYWISLMEEVTKKTKDRNVLIAAVARVSNLLESQTELHETMSEPQKILQDDGSFATTDQKGVGKFIRGVTDISLQQPLIARTLRYEDKSRSSILEEYQTRLLLQLLSLPGSDKAPFENIDTTVDLLQPKTGVDSFPALPDGYGEFLKHGTFMLFQIGMQANKPEVIREAYQRIKAIRDNKNLLLQTNRLIKPENLVARIFGNKQEKRFNYFYATKKNQDTSEYDNEYQRMTDWINDFYLRPLEQRFSKIMPNSPELVST